MNLRCACVRIQSKAAILVPVGKEGLTLNGNVPNPFNPVTRISYTLPNDGFVTLSVYDVRGRLVERLVAEVRPTGEHVVEWNAEGFATGIYFYRLQVGNFMETRKMILLK